MSAWEFTLHVHRPGKSGFTLKKKQTQSTLCIK